MKERLTHRVILLEDVEEFGVGFFERCLEVLDLGLHLGDCALFLPVLFQDDGGALLVLTMAFAEFMVVLLEFAVGCFVD